MVHFIATYGQLGILHHLEKLLKQLRDKNWFKTLIAPWNIAKIDEEGHMFSFRRYLWGVIWFFFSFLIGEGKDAMKMKTLIQIGSEFIH